MAFADIDLRDNGSGSFDIALTSGSGVTVNANLGVATATGLAAVPELAFQQDSVAYLLRDKFTANQNPLVDGNASEGSGVGYRDVTGTSFYAAGGRLRGGHNSSEGKIVYKPSSGVSGWTRQGGRTFAAMITPDDAEGDVSLWLAETAGTLNGYGIRFAGKTVYCKDPNGTEITALIVDSLQAAKAIPYLVGITLNEERGAVYWISTDTSYTPAGDWEIPAYPDARILYVTTNGTFTTVHPTLWANSGFNYPGGVVIEDARLMDIADWDGADGMALVADRFNRADSSTTMGGSWAEDSGNWGISSNKAYTTDGGRAAINAGVSDYWIVTRVDVATVSNDNFGILLRRNASDATDYAYIASENTQNVYLKRWINNGFVDTDYSTYMAWADSTTVQFLVGANGNQVRAWFDGGNATVMQPDTLNDTQHQTGTYVGLYGDPNTRWDYFAAYPIKIALPTATFGKGAYPKRFTVDSVDVNNSTFTGTNGTAITSYSPVTGGNWSVMNGTWTIQSNRIEATGTGDLATYVNSNYADVQVSVDVVTPGTVTQLRNGLILRRSDDNNFVRVRLFQDDVSQLNQDEIEILETIGGSGAVVHKCYLSDFFLTNTSYTLKVQVQGDELLVMLNNVTHIRTILSNSALLSGTGFGIYREDAAANTGFDNFSVQKLGTFVYGALGAATATGLQATVTPGAVTVSASLGVATETGLAATVTSHSLVNANLGVASAAGLTATPSSSSSPQTVNAALGVGTATGLAATITSHSRVAANLGVGTSAGLTAAVTSHSLVAANLGVGTATGLQASITSHSRVDAVLGVVTGVGLTASPSAGSAPQTVNAALGILSATGNTSVITSHSRVEASNGVLVGVGLSATITSHSLVQASIGTVSLIGRPSTVTGGPVTVQAGLGVLAANGNLASVYSGDNPIVYVRINTLRRRQE